MDSARPQLSGKKRILKIGSQTQKLWPGTLWPFRFSLRSGNLAVISVAIRLPAVTVKVVAAPAVNAPRNVVVNCGDAGVTRVTRVSVTVTRGNSGGDLAVLAVRR